MLGAIIGDVIGSAYERPSQSTKKYDFDLWTDRSHFTDDTVMTLAIGQALKSHLAGNESFVEACRYQMRQYGRTYPNLAYGKSFKAWLSASDQAANPSYGNGAAMRVSPIAWFATNQNQCLQLAKSQALVSHDHEEAVIGAQAAALAVFLARQGARKIEIKQAITQLADYQLDTDLADIRPGYYFQVRASQSVPQAIMAFLQSQNFEDAIRLAVSLGGDADTLAAIAGSIGQAYYGVPATMVDQVRAYLPDQLWQDYQSLWAWLRTRTN
ncbi:hypothetical protein AWM75_00450 [Aerococcus urinaehominis]|uniref:Uncharacterized protein n=1 Tax=Aerococcus urinaehominis TaxID=128944 RepID=A0A0X8FJM3_9LACT|nr:ADP-ribosylglycohydrolase family protein [Aerococcus urinaehominis]AMB98553.1 hypothetical protein AWM75_00450 [Aerococcus urinaehominis]SDL78293.1 ADP-ribosylglycohydrolase [Aerococcus urinaehominis]